MSGFSQLIPLLTAAGILLAGNGIQGTLITLRANIEGFDPTLIGLMGTAYFAGFALSCLAAPKLIRFVGHVRVFAALAAIASAATLMLVLVVDSYMWMAVRFATTVRARGSGRTKSPGASVTVCHASYGFAYPMAPCDSTISCTGRLRSMPRRSTTSSCFAQMALRPTT